MTLKREDGRWCPARITLLCTVIATTSGVVIAVPVMVDCTKKFVSPWTELPLQVKHIEEKLDKVIDTLNLQIYTLNERTNKEFGTP